MAQNQLSMSRDHPLAINSRLGLSAGRRDGLFADACTGVPLSLPSILTIPSASGVNSLAGSCDLEAGKYKSGVTGNLVHIMHGRDCRMQLYFYRVTAGLHEGNAVRTGSVRLHVLDLEYVDKKD